MQYIIMYMTMDTERDIFYGYEIVVYTLLLVCGVSSCWEIAREGPIQGVSCRSCELLQWTEKKDDRQGWWNAGLVMDYKLKYCSSVQVDR
jgi:hypothetical protein